MRSMISRNNSSHGFGCQYGRLLLHSLAHASTMLVLLLLLIGTTSAQQSNGSNATSSEKVYYAPDDRAMEGNYLVVFRNTTTFDAMSGLMQEWAQNVTDAHLGNMFQEAILCTSMSLDDDGQTWQGLTTARKRRERKMSRLLNSDLVEFVEEDQRIDLLADQNFPTWGLDRIDQSNNTLDNNYHYDQTGAGVTAYVVDTGIRSTHDDFGGRVTCGFNVFEGTEDCEDGNGHGTHVAGTVGGETYGVAKQVSLVTVKVLDSQGGGATSGVLAGVDYVAQQGATGRGKLVANMSLGGFFSPTLNLAVAAATIRGVFVVVAAGNSNANACLSSPSGSQPVVTVGATDRNDNRASFSNFGSCVDIFAPGVDITSAWKDSDTSTNTISGTSMASPHVAGVAALYLEAFPNMTLLEIKDRMVQTAVSGAVVDPSNSPNVLVNTENLFTTTPMPPASAAAFRVVTYSTLSSYGLMMSSFLLAVMISACTWVMV